jgi:acylphosphatase
MDLVKRVRAQVTGRVQGVMFRDSCRREAGRLGVVGWVRNEPDGSVLLEAEGDEPDVDTLVAWCRSGPPGARVSDVSTHEVPAEGGDDFRVTW